MLDELLSQDHPSVAIVGTGGMGKSHLISELARRWTDSGRRVYLWSGRLLERKTALEAADELFETLGLERPSDVRAAWHLLIERLVEEQAVLLVDDAQWLDVESLRMLVAVCERAPERGIVVIAAHRPAYGEELAALDAALSRREPVVHLAPWSADEVATCARSILGCPPDRRVVEALLARTGGVPLYVDRLVRAWAGAGTIQEGALVRDPGALPAVAAQLVVTKLAQLPPSARLVVTGITVGTSLDDELLAALFGLSASELDSTVTELRNAGLLSPDKPVLLPLVEEAVDALTPLLTQRDLHLRLATILKKRSAPAAQVAEHLLAGSARGAEVAEVMVQAGDQTLAEAPEMAAEWYQEAVKAGADPALLAARRAEAAVLSGSPDDALIFLDQVLSGGRPADQRRALAVLAAVLPGRGRWGRAAQIYERLSVEEPGAEAFYAVVGLVGTGEGGRARDLWLQTSQGLPGAASLQAQSAALMARGALESIGADPLSCLATFQESAELMEAGQRPWIAPDTPHAMGALAALAAMELVDAEQLLRRVIGSSATGSGAMPRCRLLLGWVGLRTGRFAMAEEALDSVAHALSRLGYRDQLVAAALKAGLARRRSDQERLGEARAEALRVLRRQEPDLYLSEFLAELALALPDEPLAQSRFSEVEALCARLNNPPLWQLPMRWSALFGSLFAGDPSATELHAKALAAVEPVSPGWAAAQSAALASYESSAGEVDIAAILRAIDGLGRIGLIWEAARIAGSTAALADPAASRGLLERAREIAAALSSADAGVPGALLGLSERELEVGALVVSGLTHKEIGAQLFISPKTVEHHVARIRQRLGVETRVRLLEELRRVLPAG